MSYDEYEYEYHDVADDADYIDHDDIYGDQDEDLQTANEIEDGYQDYIQEYNNYYHDIIDELDD